MTPAELGAVVDELGVLKGGRLQRVDVVDEREIVFELRLPGWTARLLASARPGAARVHSVDARPPKLIPHGPLQAFLRTRLVEQRLADIGAKGLTVRLVFERDTLELDLRGGRRALSVRPGGAPPPEATPREQRPDLPISAALAAAHAAHAPELEEARIREAASRALRSERKRLKRLEKNLLSDLDKLDGYQAARHRGELLKTVLSRVPRGSASVVAFDWESGQEVEIPLDPARSPQANLQRLFDRAKKADRGRPRVESRLEQVWIRLEAIDRQLATIASATGQELRAQAGGGLEGFVGFERRAKPAEPSKLERVARRFVAADGAEIWVGRGAERNDELTFGFGRGDDSWLHARGTAGAHVILRVPPGKQASQEALLDAAHLAAHYSSQRAEANAEVMVAERRHVKKTKGAPAGAVGVAKSRTLVVRMEPARIDRLFGRGAE